jgi:hypothetical protein
VQHCLVGSEMCIRDSIQMNKYQDGKIYRIAVGNRFYYGSTTHSLSHRYNQHVRAMQGGKTAPLYSAMRNNESCISLIEHFPCNNRTELRQREDQYIRIGKGNPLCLNKNLAFQSRQERLGYLREVNGEEIVCDCGCKVTKGNIQRHRATPTHTYKLNLRAMSASAVL